MISGWRVAALAELADLVREHGEFGRLSVVAVNGHSSSGKTTLAGRLVDALPDAAVLHTDDLARDGGVFAWDVPLGDEVLPVVRAGQPLDLPPPRWWQARGLTGSVTLPGSLSFLVVEGVGASQASVRNELDAVIWVETEEITRLGRDVVRVEENGEMSVADYRSWMAEENAYVVAERPWEHADLVVYGGLAVEHDPETEVVLGVVSAP